MFKENLSHKQSEIFSTLNYLSPEKKKKVLESEEYAFYHLIFCNIDETKFSHLYSKKESRPNAPINTLVSALILKHERGLTFEELFHAIDFDILTRTALGLHNLNDTPFCPASIFNFQNRIAEDYIQTGKNLFEEVFDNLTEKELKTLKLKTNIQRADSFLIASNICNYSRIQLLVEVLLRVERVLTDSDKQKWADILAPYTKQSAGQYIYRLKNSDIPHELEKLAQIYHTLHQALKPIYGDTEIFKIFDRVYQEHFTFVEEKLTVIPSQELSSGVLQSPDDTDATYRKKRDEEMKGEVVNVAETAHPENPVNLIVDIAVEANNIDDSNILNERIDGMKEKTPDLDELHTDGGFGSEKNDVKMEEMGINHVQTAIKGPQAEVKMNIQQISSEEYEVSCPEQTVHSQKAKKRHKACFDMNICTQCPFKEQCPTITLKDQRVFYFTHKDYLRHKRHKNILNLPPERQKLRPNVEATVREFLVKVPDKKLSTRGKFKTQLFAYSRGISINFGRIFRFLASQEGKNFGKNPIFAFFFDFIFSLYHFIRNSRIKMAMG